MKCPHCASTETGVYDSRPRCDGGLVWRRRRCPICLEKFSTYEIVTDDKTVLVAPGREPVEVDVDALLALLTPQLRAGLAELLEVGESRKARS